MNVNFGRAEFVTSYFDPRKLPEEKKPEIVLAGRSNVGKSSLINTLLNRKSLARVSSTPGKTVSVNYYNIDDKLHLVDLPGYGFAKRPKSEQAAWGKLTDGYFSAGRDIRLILLLIDLRHPPTKDDLAMYDWLMSTEILFCIVGTKCDKLSKTEAANNTAALSKTFGVNVIPFSSLNGTGCETIREIIADVTGETP